MRPVTFSYSLYRGAASPIIPIQGIQMERGHRIHSMVGDGSMIPVYIHRIAVLIGPFEFPAHIGFSNRLGVGFNLLGRQDVFTRFDVTFSDSRRRIHFKPVR